MSPSPRDRHLYITLWHQTEQAWVIWLAAHVCLRLFIPHPSLPRGGSRVDGVTAAIALWLHEGKADDKLKQNSRSADQRKNFLMV